VVSPPRTGHRIYPSSSKKFGRADKGAEDQSDLCLLGSVLELRGRKRSSSNSLAEAQHPDASAAKNWPLASRRKYFNPASAKTLGEARDDETNRDRARWTAGCRTPEGIEEQANRAGRSIAAASESQRRQPASPSKRRPSTSQSASQTQPLLGVLVSSNGLSLTTIGGAIMRPAAVRAAEDGHVPRHVRGFNRPYDTSYRALKLPRISPLLGALSPVARGRFAAGGPRPPTIGATGHGSFPRYRELRSAMIGVAEGGP
jgi:hypothetical protein